MNVLVLKSVAGLPCIGNYHAVTAGPVPLWLCWFTLKGDRAGERQYPAVGAGIYCAPPVRPPRWSYMGTGCASGGPLVEWPPVVTELIKSGSQLYYIIYTSRELEGKLWPSGFPYRQGTTTKVLCWSGCATLRYRQLCYRKEEVCNNTDIVTTQGACFTYSVMWVNVLPIQQGSDSFSFWTMLMLLHCDPFVLSGLHETSQIHGCQPLRFHCKVYDILCPIITL